MLQTAIKISTKTKHRLSEIGKKGMTYDEIVSELLSKMEDINAN